MPNQGRTVYWIIFACTVLGGIVAAFDLSDRLTGTAKDGGEVVILTPKHLERLDTASLTETEEAVVQALGDRLSTLDCSGLSIVDVSVAEIDTPKDRTTSGFDGFYLEGIVKLGRAEETVSFELAGSGKGPARQGIAVQNAIDGAVKALEETEFLDFCKR